MQIRFTLPEATFTVTLNGSTAARALVEQLPLTVSLRDFHGIEKVADLPDRLRTDGAPAGVAARTGDLTYYSPWGNLAFFYKDFGFADGLVALGSVDGSAAVLSSIADGTVAEVTVVD